ncbi:hypothetical protein [Cupriavidus malaysiensis]|uniref:DUF2441 domain-containing protein n=1 Tax=Cupriavidus malaysiensis TaxID=367825 RepID=A0ABM6F5M2_9BURK|nr:hypothetical protein [Cupriavidus malaysiensis]AOZ06790.1 hypothetical protein BKK80_13905 [Cupriavidus malaysiensis]
MTTFFHVTSAPVAVGSVIEPGNWGNLLNQYRIGAQNIKPLGNPWLLSRELAFELTRSSIPQFRSKPSRLNSCFLFTDIGHANNHMNTQSELATRIFIAEIVDPSAASHTGDYELINLPASDFLPAITQHAQRYWAGESPRVPEVLTESPIRLVSVVNGWPNQFKPSAE